MYIAMLCMKCGEELQTVVDTKAKKLRLLCSRQGCNKLYDIKTTDIDDDIVKWLLDNLEEKETKRDNLFYCRMTHLCSSIRTIERVKG